MKYNNYTHLIAFINQFDGLHDDYKDDDNSDDNNNKDDITICYYEKRKGEDE